MIEIKNVSKIYQTNVVKTVALDDISLRIKEGEFVAIIGPSGSGKSTLMHIIGCLDTPTSGKYFLDNQDVSKLDEDLLADIRKNKIGFIFQSFNLLSRSSVLRNVILPLVYVMTPKEKRETIAREALKDAGLDENHFYHLSNQLSGGQMQRVAIARSLVNNPKIILADEPTGNLDSKTGDAVLKTFKDLNAKGRTIILITHEAEVAEHANHIITIKDGKIVADIYKN